MYSFEVDYTHDNFFGMAYNCIANGLPIIRNSWVKLDIELKWFNPKGREFLEEEKRTEDMQRNDS